MKWEEARKGYLRTLREMAWGSRPSFVPERALSRVGMSTITDASNDNNFLLVMWRGGDGMTRAVIKLSTNVKVELRQMFA